MLIHSIGRISLFDVSEGADLCGTGAGWPVVKPTDNYDINEQFANCMSAQTTSINQADLSYFYSDLYMLTWLNFFFNVGPPKDDIFFDHLL